MMLCLQQAPYNSERQLQVIEKETQHLNKFNPHLITEEESPFILSLSLSLPLSLWGRILQ